jgi:histidinol-phosphatase
VSARGPSGIADVDEPFRAPEPSSELGATFQLAMACCDEADALSLTSFGRGIEIEAKPDASFVTAADRAVERAIRKRITARWPEHGLVGEEYGEEDRGAAGAGGRRWIIDPIDGTHSYMRGVPLFATLLAYEADGRLEVGVVSAPGLHRRWFAWRGGGAWSVDTGGGGADLRTATRLHVSGVADIAEAHLLLSSWVSLRESVLAPGFAELADRVWRERAYGDFWGYMLVAEGAAELMLESDLKLWDIAAPRLVVEEAGGRLSDLVGGQDLPAKGVLASNGAIHDEALRILRGRDAAGA